MVLLAGHAPPANTAADETGKQVATAGPARSPTGGSTECFLGGSKQAGVDDRFVFLPVGECNCLQRLPVSKLEP